MVCDRFTTQSCSDPHNISIYRKFNATTVEDSVLIRLSYVKFDYFVRESFLAECKKICSLLYQNLPGL